MMDKEFYRSAIRSVSDGVIAADAAGRLILLNPAAEKSLAVDGAKFVGRPLSELLKFTDAAGAAAESPVTRVLRTGESFVCDDRSTFLIGQNDSPFPVGYSIAAIDSERGERIGALFIFRDVSAELSPERGILADRTSSAAAIGRTQETTELFELSEIRKVVSFALEQLDTAENPQEGVRLILKNLCEIIGFSRAFIVSFGDNDEAVELYTSYFPDGERPLFDVRILSPAESHESAWFRFMPHSRTKEVFHFDFTDGEDLMRAKLRFPGIWSKKDTFDIRGLRVSYVFVSDKLWGCIGFVAQHQPMKQLSMNEVRLLEMAVHIIELAISREQTVAKLKQALEESRVADNAKSFFLASMSHEIRTPLNAVLGFADLLNSASLDPATQREYIANISFAGHSLLQLINDILDLSKLEAGQVVFVPERTNLREFCREIAALFSHSANEKNLKLLFDTENLPDVYIDQQRLRQILFNLVGNAIKFTSAGGITVDMELKKTAKGEGDLIVCVKDSGAGIAQADCERLFEPFVQLTRMRGTNASNNGTGLGLPIVKKMITQMGGVISVTSKPERGSCFQFMIPGVRCDDWEIENDDAANAPKAGGLCPPNEEPRVLLVDDSAINLKALSAMLRRLQIYHETALSGGQALRALKEGNFNIVLTDLFMPQMSGEELARLIRADSKYSSIRIAVVTAEQDRRSYDATLFDAVMEKPISRDALYESIYGS